MLKHLLLLGIVFYSFLFCPNCLSQPLTNTNVYVMNQVNELQNEIYKNRKTMDSLRNLNISHELVRSIIDQYYTDIDQYYKHINITITILGFLFAVINILIIAYGWGINNQSKKEIESLKYQIDRDFEKLSKNTSITIEGLERRTSEIISIVEKVIKQFGESGNSIIETISHKEKGILEKVEKSEKSLFMINEVFYKSLALFIDKLISIKPEDTILQMQLLAISQRLQYMSYDPQVRTMALLSLAYSGDYSDKAFLTAIIEDENEIGKVRVAAQQALEILTKQIPHIPTQLNNEKSI